MAHHDFSQATATVESLPPFSPQDEDAYQQWKKIAAPRGGDEAQLRAQFRAGLAPGGQSGHWPSGPLPVLPLDPRTKPQRVLPLDQTMSQRVGRHHNLLGGPEAAIENPMLPETVRDIGVPVGGMLAASAAAPIAGLTGVLTGGGPLVAGPIEAGAFAGGAKGADELIRAFERIAGYRSPKRGTLGEQATEFGGQMLAYPIANLLAEGVGYGVKALSGIPARQRALQKAAEDMEAQFLTLNDLHDSVVNTVTGAEKRSQAALQTGEKEAKKTITARALRSPIDMLSVTPSEAELGARATNLSASAILRQRDVAPIEGLYREIQGKLGNEYEALVEPYLPLAVPEAARTKASAWAQNLQERSRQYPIGPKLQGLIDEAAQWGPTNFRIGGQVLPLPQSAQSGGKPVSDIEPVTWARIKKMRGELRPFFNSNEPSERGAARALDAGLTDAYASGGFPVNPELNARYSDWRKRWTPQALGVLHRARTPEQLSRIANEGTLGPFVASGDPAAIAAVRNVVGRVIQAEGLKPNQIMERFSPRVLRQIFGPGADSVSNWAKVYAQGPEIQTLLNLAPDVKSSLVQSINHTVQQEQGKATAKIKDEVVGWLGKLGAPAKELTTRVRAMPAEDVTRYYMDYLSKPKFAQDMIAEAQRLTPIMTKKQMAIRGIGSIPFAAGLGTMEMARHGEVSSPYVYSVPLALAGEAAFVFAPSLVVRLIEADGMQPVMRLLNRVTNPRTRGVAVKALGKRIAQLSVSDAFRAALQPADEQASELPEVPD